MTSTHPHGQVRRIGRGIAMACALVIVSAGARSDRIDAAQARDPQRPTAPARDPAAANPVGSSVIAGRVMSGETVPRPVRRAVVALTGAQHLTLMVLTDDDGRYQFDGVPAGQYMLATMKSGWVNGYYGSTRPGRGPGTRLMVQAGARVTADLTIVPGAVIAGRVVDQFGRPHQGARVQVFESRSMAGRRVLRPLPGLTISVSDDRGEYRVYGLPPGTFAVAASPPQTSATPITTPEDVAWALEQAQGSSPTSPAPPRGPALGYAPVFYPGQLDPDRATAVTVAAGDERTGIDFPLSFVPMSQVRGVVLRPDGAPQANAQVMLSPADDGAVITNVSPPVLRASTSPDGTFTFSGARPPGRYRLIARGSSTPQGRGRTGGPAPQLDLFASADLTLTGRDTGNLELLLQPAAVVRGQLVFEPHALPPPDLSRVRIQMVPPDAGMISRPGAVDMYNVSAQADGTFVLPGVSPGTYVLLGSAPLTPNAIASGARWMVKSVRWRGQDVTDRPITISDGEQVSDLVITFTADVAELSGTMVDATGAPVGGHFIFVFPTDRTQWTPTSRRFRPPSTPSSDGTYRITPLPPGDYYLAALTEFDPIDAYDDALLEQLIAASIRVTLREGEKKRQDLRIR